MTTQTLTKAVVANSQTWGNATITRNNNQYEYLDLTSSNEYDKYRYAVQSHLTRYDMSGYPITVMGVAQYRADDMAKSLWYVAIYKDCNGIQQEERIGDAEFERDLQSYEDTYNPNGTFIEAVEKQTKASITYKYPNLTTKALVLTYEVLRFTRSDYEFATVWVDVSANKNQISIHTVRGTKCFDCHQDAIVFINQMIKDAQKESINDQKNKVNKENNPIYQRFVALVSA